MQTMEEYERSLLLLCCGGGDSCDVLLLRVNHMCLKPEAANNYRL